MPTAENKKALIIQHVAVESLAENFMAVLLKNKFNLEFVKIFESYPSYDTFSAPPIENVHLLIVLGGPFSANDEFPALIKEREYIRQALNNNVPVFGICLGAQIMAQVLGGVVKPTGGFQFGLRKIEVTEEGAKDPVFGKIYVPLVPTLHGDCFSIPKGALKLAEGYILTRDGQYIRINMAFRYKKSYGFQFEPQLTLNEFLRWNKELRGDYKLMGPRFNPDDEAAKNEREFTRYAQLHETQMREMFIAFLKNASLI